MIEINDLSDVIRAKENIDEYEKERQVKYSEQAKLYDELRLQAYNYLNSVSDNITKFKETDDEYEKERKKISEKLKKLEREIEEINNIQINFASKITEFTEKYEDVREELKTKQRLLREYEFLLEKSKRLNDDDVINIFVSKIQELKNEIQKLVYELACFGDKKLLKEKDSHFESQGSNIDETNNSELIINHRDEEEHIEPVSEEVNPITDNDVTPESDVHNIEKDNEGSNVELKNIDTSSYDDFDTQFETSDSIDSFDSFDVPTEEELNTINDSAFTDEEEYVVKNVREANPFEKEKYKVPKLALKSVALKSLIIVASALVFGPFVAIPGIVGYNVLANKIKKGSWNPTERHLQVLKKDIISIMNIGKPKTDGGKVR